MINTFAYDVEILPNFFSVTIVSIDDYLKVFRDACNINKKGKKEPIPLVQKFSVKEIVDKLNIVKKYKFYITDTDDSQLLTILGFFNNLRPRYDENNKVIVNHLFGYNSSKYDKLMIAGFLMYANQVDSTKELILKLYNLSKHIIELQDNPETVRHDYLISTLHKYNIPYKDVDVMTIFALNKVGKGVDAKGNTIYFGKSLKQTSINLQWYELLEHELPPISEKDAGLYAKDTNYGGLAIWQLNKLVNKWDRYIIPEWIDSIMHYNCNDVFIVCEIVRLYIDEIKLRYSISKAYEVDVLSSSRSNIADRLFVKFYSEFSGLAESKWRGKTTERTSMSFKRVIFPFIHFKTPLLQNLLEDMKKVVVHSIGKDAFQREVKLGNLTYTIATGGLHSQDVPRELKSKLHYINPSFTGEETDGDVWKLIDDDSYVYVHFDIASFYPSIMVAYEIAPEHINKGCFVKLVKWLKETRVAAKHSTEDYIDGIPKDVLAQVLKIVINSIYGKLGICNAQ